ncbi:MAG: TRAP transporter small permease [Thermodesulfobacteriota bacterium]
MKGVSISKAKAKWNRFNDFLSILSCIIVIFLMLSVTYEVIMRYVFNRPTSWVVDIASLALLYMTFMGGAWLLRNEGHVVIDLVLSSFGPRSRSILDISTSLLAGLACLILALYGTRVTWEHYQDGVRIWGALALPSSLTLFIIPFGFYLLSIQFLIRAYEKGKIPGGGEP